MAFSLAIQLIKKPDSAPIARLQAEAELPAAMPSAAGAVAKLAASSRTAMERCDLDARRERDEKLAVLARVNQVKREYMVGDEVAVQLVADAPETPSRFPLLSTGGHGGGTKINIHNVRNWRRLCGMMPNGDPDPRGADRLVAAYHACGSQVLANEVFRQWYRAIETELDGSRQTSRFYDELNARGGTLVDALFDAGAIKSGSREFWKRLFRAYMSNHGNLAKAQVSAEMLSRAAGIPESGILAYPDVYYWFKKYLPKEVEILAKERERGLKNQIVGYVDRSWDAVRVGEMLVGDTHTFDAFAVMVEEDGRMVAKRPRLAAWIDAKSLRFVGFNISIEESGSAQVIDALGMAVATLGNRVPLMLCTDNGSDYCRVGFSEPVYTDDGHEHCITAELGTEVTRATAYLARVKTIERVFKEFVQGFATWFASWSGGDTDGADINRANINYFLRNPQDLPNLHEFTRIFGLALKAYHEKRQGGKILAGKSPDEVWAEYAPLSPERTPEDLYMRFLMPVGTRQVQRGYCVRLMNQYWRNGEALGPWLEKRVLLKVSCVDKRVFAFDQAGRLLGELEQVPQVAAIARSDDDKQILAQEMALQKWQAKRAMTLRRGLTGQYEVVSTYDNLLVDAGGHELVRMGEAGSVKGNAHKFTYYQAKPIGWQEEQAEAARLIAPAPAQKPTAEDRRKRQELLDVMAECKGIRPIEEKCGPAKPVVNIGELLEEGQAPQPELSAAEMRAALSDL
jgi:hypothetical protein